MEFWLVVVLIAAALAAAFWWMDGIGGTPLPHIPAAGMPDEPCWTDELRTEGGLSYGRQGCYRGQIDEMEVRVSAGDLQPRAGD